MGPYIVTEYRAAPNARALFVRDVFRQFFDARRSFLEVFERCVIKGWPDRKAAVRVNFRLQELFYARETLRLAHLVNHSASNEGAWGSYASLSNVHERLDVGWSDLDEDTLKNSDSAYWSTQDSVDTLLRALCIGLEGLRADAAEVKMAPCGIVERVDVVGQVRQGELPVLVDALPDPLLLQACKERFSNRIVPAVSSPAHARFQVISSAEPSPVIAPVLAALIRMDDGLSRPPTSNGDPHGIQHQLAA